MVVDDFLRCFPEFLQTDPLLIAAKLQLALARMGGANATRVWGCFAPPGGDPTFADLAQGNLAAHYLVTSPFGTSTAMADKGGDTSYLQEFRQAARSVSFRLIVAGGM